jgi:hypothetical protein
MGNPITIRMVWIWLLKPVNSLAEYIPINQAD